jgi:hypothetical protein
MEQETDTMARVNWLDDDNDHPLIDEHVQKLERFTAALADGLIDDRELAQQQAALVAAMKAVEPALSDELHAKVTTLLVELTAFNTLTFLHGLVTERVRKAFPQT